MKYGIEYYDEKIKELEGRIEQLEAENKKDKAHFILNDTQIELLIVALKKIDAYLDMMSGERR